MAHQHHDHGLGLEAAAEIADLDAALAFLDGVLERWGGVHKARPAVTDPEWIDSVAGVLAAKLAKAAAVTEAQAKRKVQAAIRGVRWADLTPGAAVARVNSAVLGVRDTLKPIERTVGFETSKTAKLVVDAVRGDARSKGLAIAANWNAFDRRLAERIVGHQTAFVTASNGEMLARASADAQAAVVAGLEQGLGTADIAERLQRQLGARVGRSAAYWGVVAGAFTNTARSLSQLSSYGEAGITTYRIEAVLDEVTTEQCRFMHGKEFSVGGSLKVAAKALRAQSPGTIKAAAPWLRMGRGPGGQRRLWYKDRVGRRRPVANITRSGLGVADDPGTFGKALTPDKLQSAGVA